MISVCLGRWGTRQSKKRTDLVDHVRGKSESIHYQEFLCGSDRNGICLRCVGPISSSSCSISASKRANSVLWLSRNSVASVAEWKRRAGWALRTYQSGQILGSRQTPQPFGSHVSATLVVKLEHLLLFGEAWDVLISSVSDDDIDAVAAWARCM